MVDACSSLEGISESRSSSIVKGIRDRLAFRRYTRHFPRGQSTALWQRCDHEVHRAKVNLVLERQGLSRYGGQRLCRLRTRKSKPRPFTGTVPGLDEIALKTAPVLTDVAAKDNNRHRLRGQTLERSRVQANCSSLWNLPRGCAMKEKSCPAAAGFWGCSSSTLWQRCHILIHAQCFAALSLSLKSGRPLALELSIFNQSDRKDSSASSSLQDEDRHFMEA